MNSDLSVMASFIVTIFFTLFWIINPTSKKGKFILKILFAISSAISFIILFVSLDKKLILNECPSLLFNSKTLYGGESEQGDSACATFLIKVAENKSAFNLKDEFYCFVKNNGKYTLISNIFNINNIKEIDGEYKKIKYPFIYKQKVNDTIYFYLKINFQNGICCDQKPLLEILKNNNSLNCFTEVGEIESNEIAKLIH